MNADRVMVWVLLLFSTVGIVRCANVADADCSDGNEANCTGITHAECVDQACQCKQGYEDNSDSTVCTAIGLGGVCDADGDCTLVANAVCTSSTCQCANGYFKNGNACDKAVSGTDCTEAANECYDIDNAECVDMKCQCEDGFVENDDTCDEKSGAVSVKSAVAVMFGCLIMLLARAL